MDKHYAFTARAKEVFHRIWPAPGVSISGEILAGATLAALAIPEVMGYTKIAGMPVITGMYTLLLPMFLFALFGSSRHLVVGADSATAAITAAGLAGMASVETDTYVALAAMLALLAALLLILARLIGLGFLANFLSHTVLIGFLTGVGVQVALGQISGILGLKVSGHGTLEKIWSDWQQMESINYYALFIGLAVIVVILLCRKISRRLPGALIAVAVAISASWVLDLHQHVHVLGDVPRGLPGFAFPAVSLSADLIFSLAPTAFAIFVVILTQSAATSRAYAARYDEPFSENKDLFGLSVANVGAGLTGTFVVNGSPTKTQMVDSAGGRSQFSMLVACAIVLAVLLFLTGFLRYLPEAVLAAVVFLIGIELIDVNGMREVYHARRSEFWVAFITAATVVVVGVEQGIMLALALSLIDHTRRGYHPKNVLLAPDASGTWRASPITSGVQAAPGLIVYRFTHSMYYANAQLMNDQINTLTDHAVPPLRWLCIDTSSVDDVDFTASEMMRSIHAKLHKKGIHLVIAQVLPDVSQKSRVHLSEQLEEGAVFETLNQVLHAYLRYSKPKSD